MVKSNRKTLFMTVAALAASAVAFSGAAIAVAPSMSADAASYVMDAEIGPGETVSGLTITDGQPVTLDLTGVSAGQYMAKAVVTSIVRNEEEPYEFQNDVEAQVDTMEDFTFLSYSQVEKAYIGVITVADTSTSLTLSTFSLNELTVNVSLDNLYIGPATSYNLNGIDLSSESTSIELRDFVPADYTLSVNLGFGLAELPTVEAQIGEGETITLTAPDPEEVVAGEAAIYTASISIGSEPGALSVWTSSDTVIPSTISVDRVIPVVALPATAQSYEIAIPVTYSYTAAADGYYTFAVNKAEATSYFALSVNEVEDTDEGIVVVSNNYPVYLAAGQEYYVTVTYTSADSGLDSNLNPTDVPQDATATVAVDNWEAPTLEANSQMVYVPVVKQDVEGVNAVSIPLHVEAGTYDIVLTDVLYEATHVYAHYGETTKELSLPYYDTITFAGDEEEIYFTFVYIFVPDPDYPDVGPSETPDRFTMGVTISPQQPIVDDEIRLNESKTITIGANETAIYFMYNMPVGTYDVELGGDYDYISVEDAFDHPVVELGEGLGELHVTLVEGDAEGTTYTVAIAFINHSDAPVTFTVYIG